MKKLILPLLLIWSISVQAQQLSGVLEEHNRPEMDVVIFPFGMESPIKIGIVSDNGNLKIDFENINTESISKEQISNFSGWVADCFFFKCGNSEEFQQGMEGINAINCGYLSLWSDGQWVGSINAFSDQDLVPWLEDKSYNEPIKASFYQIIYVDKDVNIQKDCSTGYELSTGEIHPIYSFNIKMEKGFNVVEYTIDEIFETDPTEIASIPVKVSVSALSDPSKVKFSAKYFF